MIGGVSKPSARPVSLLYGIGRSSGSIWTSKVYDYGYMSSALQFSKAGTATINAIVESGAGTAYCDISCNGVPIISLRGTGSSGGSRNENTVSVSVGAGTVINVSVGGNYDSRWLIVVFVNG